MCAAVRAKFDPAPEAPDGPVEPVAPPVPRAAPSKPDGRRIVIVGGGIAGHVAAETARSLDAAARITLVSDETGFYNRLNLTRFLAREIERDSLFDYSAAWYDENVIELQGGTTVIGLDPIKKSVSWLRVGSWNTTRSSSLTEARPLCPRSSATACRACALCARLRTRRPLPPPPAAASGWW